MTLKNWKVTSILQNGIHVIHSTNKISWIFPDFEEFYLPLTISWGNHEESTAHY